MDYHKEFMHTQNIASDFAKKFNEVLFQVTLDYKRIPRMIHFLEPMVVEVKHEGEEQYILV